MRVKGVVRRMQSRVRVRVCAGDWCGIAIKTQRFIAYSKMRQPMIEHCRECARTEIEIDEVLRLVCDIGAKVATNDAVPGGGE